jgi:hypothetical protein
MGTVQTEGSRNTMPWRPGGLPISLPWHGGSMWRQTAGVMTRSEIRSVGAVSVAPSPDDLAGRSVVPCGRASSAPCPSMQRPNGAGAAARADRRPCRRSRRDRVIDPSAHACAVVPAAHLWGPERGRDFATMSSSAVHKAHCKGFRVRWPEEQSQTRSRRVAGAGKRNGDGHPRCMSRHGTCGAQSFD